jgi:hypothetical protein
VLAALFVAAFVVAQTCQQSQVRISKEEAIATARDEVNFTPRRTQIRLLRQGIQSKPFWIVSLSVPGEREDTFTRLATVRVDANTGEVEGVNRER